MMEQSCNFLKDSDCFYALLTAELRCSVENACVEVRRTMQQFSSSQTHILFVVKVGRVHWALWLSSPVVFKYHGNQVLSPDLAAAMASTLGWEVQFVSRVQKYFPCAILCKIREAATSVAPSSILWSISKLHSTSIGFRAGYQCSSFTHWEYMPVCSVEQLEDLSLNPQHEHK